MRPPIGIITIPTSYQSKIFVAGSIRVRNKYSRVSSRRAKTITLTQDGAEGCDFTNLYAVGAGVPDAGWGWASPINLPCQGNGVYSSVMNLNNNGGADNNFRFFTEKDNWGSGVNYPTYVSDGYTIDAKFEDAQDGDNNFAFVGTTGLYRVDIDTVNKTITVHDGK